MTIHKRRLLIAVGLLLVSVTAGCQQTEPPSSDRFRDIVVYGFSTQEKVFTEEVFPAFQADWRRQTGQEVSFQSFFGGSEELTEAILSGARTDVAILSNEQHALWLQVNDLVETDWHTFPQKGVVTRSPLVIVVRPGNPLSIKDWTDLARPGVKVIHPDPRSSGGAQWALLAEYGSALLSTGGSAQVAEAQLQTIWANVVATPASSRDALKQFMFGAGDAMITYEQDALLAQARGAALKIVMPRSTIMSEHVVVIVDRNVKASDREMVRTFVEFLWSEIAQDAFTRYYFRATTGQPLDDTVEQFHEIQQPFTVHDLGGWGQAYAEIVHTAWEEHVIE